MENITMTQRMVADTREAEISFFKDSVKCGDENHFKSLWISIEDDLPYNHEELIIKHYDLEIFETKPVFVHYRNGDFSIRHMWNHKNESWKWYPNNSDIDFWMLIPELPKNKRL